MAHKLLLADDSVTIQRVIELTFADEDVEVTTVGDGQLAIERLNADPPDIVLADVDMPKRDGYEVAEYVKSRPELAHIPVVLLTGAFEPIDQARAAASGSSDVLAKPFEPQMVINRVKQLLGKKRSTVDPSTLRQAQGRPEQGRGTTGSASSRATMDEAAQAAPSASRGAQQEYKGPTQDRQMESPMAADRDHTLNQAGQPVSLDDYFDQLDAAFSSLGGPPADDHGAAQSEADWPVQASTPPRPVAPAAPPRAAVPPAPLDPSTGSGLSRAPSRVDPAQGVPSANRGTQIAPVISPPPSPTPAQPAWRTEPAAPSVRPPAFASESGATARQAPIQPPPPPAPPAFVPDTGATARPAFAPESGGTAKPPFAPESGATARQAAMQTPRPPAPAAPNAPANPFAELSAAKAEAAARAAAPAITEEVIQEVVRRVIERLSDRVIRETVSDIVSKTAERLVQEEIEKIKGAGT